MCANVCSYHFRQQLGGQVMDGLTQYAQGGQDENHTQDDAGSAARKMHRISYRTTHPQAHWVINSIAFFFRKRILVMTEKYDDNHRTRKNLLLMPLVFQSSIFFIAFDNRSYPSCLGARGQCTAKDFIFIYFLPDADIFRRLIDLKKKSLPVSYFFAPLTLTIVKIWSAGKAFDRF